MSKDYIPRPDEEYDTFFKNIVQYVAAKALVTPPAWTHIPQAAAMALADTYAKWNNAFTPTLKPHTPVETKEKNRVRKVTEHELREFINQYLRYPPVTDADRDAMGIPNRDLIRTPHVEVEETVEFDLKLRDIREVLVDFWVKGGTGKAKPEGYDGAVIVWAVLEAPPSDPCELTQHTTASKTPYAIEFAEAQRGKTAYIAAAWENGRSHVGRWSEIQSTVIP